MSVRGSIAQRLAVSLGLSAVVLWLCAVGIAGYVIREEMNDAFNQTLRQSALRLLPLAAHEFEDMIDGDGFDDHDARFISGLTEQGANLDYFITDPAGRILIFASDAPINKTEITVKPGFSTFNEAPAFAIRDRETGIGIVVVEHAGLRTTLLRESLLAMLMPLAALIPVLIFFVYLAVRAAMKPIWKLGRVISQRHGHNLEPLGIGPQPRELAPVVDEVENLLDRLRAAIEAERSFAAESAHELRTPIAGALAQVQVLRNALNGKPDQVFAKQAEEALRNLAALSESLLQSSRLQAGFAVSSKAEMLGQIFDLVLAEGEFSAAAGRISITGKPQSLSANIVPDAFAIVLRNLLRNALLYAQGNDAVVMYCGVDWMSVSNDCAPLDPDLLDKLATRFVRGDDTKRGSGLGLSIASGIVEDCGGRLSFSSPIANQSRGFEAKVTFA